MNKFFYIAAFSILFSSCGNKNSIPTPVDNTPLSIFDIALKDTLGVLRGVDFVDEYDVIAQMEYDSALVVKSKFNLVYDYNLGNDNSINVKYIFAGTLVRSIEMNISLATEVLADSVANDFNAYFTRKYGAAVQQMGIYVWIGNTNLPEAKAVIELKDESAEFGFGKLNIMVYPRPVGRMEV